MSFITFEGGDGSGKTTQAFLLAQYMQQHNVPYVYSREPGGTKLAEKIRSILLDSSEELSAQIEFLLLTAARKDHLDTLIIPALKENKNVICDRFIDSTIVYQGLIKGLGMDEILSTSQRFLGQYYMPDITFFLDVEPKIAMQRVKSRTSAGHKANHYDIKDLEYYSIIRNHFLFLKTIFPERIIVLDGSVSEKEIHKAILQILNLL